MSKTVILVGSIRYAPISMKLTNSFMVSARGISDTNCFVDIVVAVVVVVVVFVIVFFVGGSDSDSSGGAICTPHSSFTKYSKAFQLKHT